MTLLTGKKQGRLGPHHCRVLFQGSVNRTQMPAVLIESGFIDNVKDNQFYDQNLNNIGQAIAE